LRDPFVGSRGTSSKGSIMRTAPLFALLATALACALFAAPAQAQRDRVFVASYGSDSNPCTFGSPCKTFQQALDVVAAGGEVTAIDSAGFGGVTISQAVTITSPAGVEAGIFPSAGSAAVTVSAGSNDVVSLHGLTLEGASSAEQGINVTSGGKLDVIDCTIRDFTSNAIALTEPSTETMVTISNTYISNIANAGISLTSGSHSIHATIDHLTATDSSEWYGIFAYSAANTPVDLTISNSEFSHLGAGLSTLGNSSGAVTATLSNVIFNDDADSILAGSYSNLYLSRVIMTNSSNGLDVLSGSDTDVSLYSDGSSHITLTGSPPSLTPWTLQ
jgi:hypothetical protein